MIVPASQERTTSIMAIEVASTVIAIAVAFCCPRIASGWFSYFERSFGRLARRKWLAVTTVGASALLLRLAILPLCPIPKPFIPDDFSFLLASDTFASGRLTNPTPAMWVHFETIHITMNPTYMSMYFPSTGLTLAASKVLLGNPWYGILFTNALMCAAICWMLQAWLPASWALLGGMLAVLRLGLFSYWINTYTGGGAIAALGGALVLGAVPRLVKTTRLRDGMVLACGIVLLLMSRPYEGFLLCLPSAVVIGHWALYGKNRPAPGILIRRAAAPLALIIIAFIWMGYYDYRAFGSPLTPPYSVDRSTYAVAPYYVWQQQRPDPTYRHEVMRRFYYENELPSFQKIHTLKGFFPESLIKGVNGMLFFSGFVLLPPLIMIRRVLIDRRIRFLIISVLVLMGGMLMEIFLLPHYLAPFTAAFYAIGLQGMRHLRLWKPFAEPVGLLLTRLIVALCFILAVARTFASPLHLRLAEWPPSEWNFRWYGPGVFGMERAQLETRLEDLPGKQLVIVRYSSQHNPFKEWVYNSANIDTSRVIWAREMSVAENRELIHYYKDRNVWLVQPDKQPTDISPYPISDLNGATTR